MSENQTQPKFVAIPAQVWAATIELLITELPMKKVEGLVAMLRQGQPLDGLAPGPAPEASPEE